MTYAGTVHTFQIDWNGARRSEDGLFRVGSLLKHAVDSVQAQLVPPVVGAPAYLLDEDGGTFYAIVTRIEPNGWVELTTAADLVSTFTRTPVGTTEEQ